MAQLCAGCGKKLGNITLYTCQGKDVCSDCLQKFDAKLSATDCWFCFGKNKADEPGMTVELYKKGEEIIYPDLTYTVTGDIGTSITTRWVTGYAGTLVFSKKIIIPMCKKCKTITNNVKLLTTSIKVFPIISGLILVYLIFTLMDNLLLEIIIAFFLFQFFLIIFFSCR